MLNLESGCIPVVLGGVLILRTLSNCWVINTRVLGWHIVGKKKLVQYFKLCHGWEPKDVAGVIKGLRWMLSLRWVNNNNWGQLFTVDYICNIKETGDIYSIFKEHTVWEFVQRVNIEGSSPHTMQDLWVRNITLNKDWMSCSDRLHSGELKRGGGLTRLSRELNGCALLSKLMRLLHKYTWIPLKSWYSRCIVHKLFTIINLNHRQF